MQCPVCKEEIEEGARKCKHCGSPTTPAGLRWDRIKDIGQFATFIAAIVVLSFVLWSNLMMKRSVDQAGKSVEQGRQAIDQGREAIELTKISVAKIDTGFALTREQIEIASEQLNLAKKSVEQVSKEFIEEKRPRIKITTTKIDFEDTTWVIYVDFVNWRLADAEDVSIYLVLKYVDTPEDTLRVGGDRISKITQALPLNWSAKMREPPRHADLTCFVEVRYTWKIQNLDYKEEKFFHYIYDEKLEKYRIFVLSEENIEKLWK